MECWIPLFDIFLNSPCPESEASLWIQKSFNLPSNTTQISTSSFSLLLTKPSDTTPPGKSLMWIQTLPDTVQARILSFLAYDHQRFCNKDLCKLARNMLDQGKDIDFWVRKAAQKLLDLVSISNYQWLSHLNLDSEEECVYDEFQSVPDWLKDVAKDSEPLFSWLPISPDELIPKMPFTVCGGNAEESSVDVEEKKVEDTDEVMGEFEVEETKFDETIDSELEERAKSLKLQFSNLDYASKAVNLAKQIRDLCVDSKGKSLAVLNLIEPWNADDETSAVLVSHMRDTSDIDEFDFPSHILCSFLLPKFLLLKEPSSRTLITATIEYCKSHQKSAECALLFPLMLRVEGINNHLCDVITKIVKESVHPAHVSAFIQRLLCKEVRKLICLPCHRCMIGDEMVWTESMFGLFQNILNHNVHLTQDSVDQLVNRVCECAERYSKSLKFGNFFLCLVGKCGPMLKVHKLLLITAAEKTNNLVTKSVLSKLSAL